MGTNARHASTSGATSQTSADAGADTNASATGLGSDVLDGVDGARSDEAQHRSASAWVVALAVVEPSVPDCIGQECS
jgi:hypothetical protein